MILFSSSKKGLFTFNCDISLSIFFAMVTSTGILVGKEGNSCSIALRIIAIVRFSNELGSCNEDKAVVASAVAVVVGPWFERSTRNRCSTKYSSTYEIKNDE